VPDVTVPQKVVRVVTLLLVVSIATGNIKSCSSTGITIKSKMRKKQRLSVHAMKAYSESRGMAPLFLNLVPMEISHVTTVPTGG